MRCWACRSPATTPTRTGPAHSGGIRHAWLTDLCQQIHTDSRGTYGSRRVHAELTIGRGLTLGHNQVELVMRRAGIPGLTGRPAWKRMTNLATAADLVNRDFTTTEPDRLWVTDIERHEALLNREEVQGLLPRVVAAAREKLGAA